MVNITVSKSFKSFVCLFSLSLSLCLSHLLSTSYPYESNKARDIFINKCHANSFIFIMVSSLIIMMVVYITLSVFCIWDHKTVSCLCNHHHFLYVYAIQTHTHTHTHIYIYIYLYIYIYMYDYLYLGTL